MKFNWGAYKICFLFQYKKKKKNSNGCSWRTYERTYYIWKMSKQCTHKKSFNLLNLLIWWQSPWASKINSLLWVWEFCLFLKFYSSLMQKIANVGMFVYVCVCVCQGISIKCWCWWLKQKLLVCHCRRIQKQIWLKIFLMLLVGVLQVNLYS